MFPKRDRLWAGRLLELKHGIKDTAIYKRLLKADVFNRCLVREKAVGMSRHKPMQRKHPEDQAIKGLYTARKGSRDNS